MLHQFNRRRRQFMRSAAIGSGAALLGINGTDALGAWLLAQPPRSKDDVAQRAAVVAFFTAMYDARGRLDAAGFAAHFADPAITQDAVFRGSCGTAQARQQRAENNTLFKRIGTPGKLSTFVHATGDMRYGAVVEYVDLAGSFFHTDFDVLNVVELKDGLAARTTDYWDSRQLTQVDISEEGAKIGVLSPAGPVHPGGTPRSMLQPCVPGKIPGDTPHASKEMVSFTQNLHGMLSAGNVDGVVKLLTDDAVFIHPLVQPGAPGYAGFNRDIQIKGRNAIERMLKAVLRQLPDGAQSTLTNVVGGTSGGGYEWTAGGMYAKQGLAREGIRGATGLDLIGNQIERMSVKFDTMQMTQEQRDEIKRALGK